MITFEEAIDIVRKKLPDDLIQYGWEFDGQFIFMTSMGKKLVKNDLATMYAIVDKRTGKFSTDAWFGYQLNLIMGGRMEEFERAMKKAKYVDVTKEELDECRKESMEELRKEAEMNQN